MLPSTIRRSRICQICILSGLDFGSNEFPLIQAAWCHWNKHWLLHSPFIWSSKIVHGKKNLWCVFKEKNWMQAMGFSIIHSFVVANLPKRGWKNNWWFENLEGCGNRKVLSIASMCSKWKHSKILPHMIPPMERERTASPSSFQPSLFCYFPCFWILNHLRTTIHPWYQPCWIIRVAVIMLGTISSVPISRRWKKTGTRWNHSKEPQWSQQ